MSSVNGGKKTRFNQLPEDERRERVAQMQPEPLVVFQVVVNALSNGQVMVGCPDGMQDTIRGCATVQDVLAKGIRVMAAKLADLEPTEESRIQVVGPGALPKLQG